MSSFRLIKSTMPKRRKYAGFTLIEVLVTVVVVSIGLLGLAGLQINGLRANMSSEARSKATMLANDIIERMRANPKGIEDGSYNSITTAGAACGGEPDPFCSNSSSGAAESCDTAEMAAFDAWVWACGMPIPNADVVRGGVINQLSQGTGVVDCDDVLCTLASTYTITVSWDERNLNSTADTSGANTTQNITLVVAP